MASRLGCAIIDANVVAEAFGETPNDAGAGFRRWISNGEGQLVSGGKLHEELRQASHRFREWAAVAQSTAQLRLIGARLSAQVVRDFEAHASRQSNDPHILALSSVSGARLLYSNDDALQQDFRNPELINNPRGRVYSTRVNASFDGQKRNLLRNAPPCGSP